MTCDGIFCFQSLSLSAGYLVGVQKHLVGDKIRQTLLREGLVALPDLRIFVELADHGIEPFISVPYIQAQMPKQKVIGTEYHSYDSRKEVSNLLVLGVEILSNLRQ